MNDKYFLPIDDDVLKSLANKVDDNRTDLISRYQQALRETLFTNRSTMRPAELARVAEGEADALISSLRNSLSSTKAQGAALSDMGLSRQAFFGLLQAMREFFIAHFENDFSALNIYTLYRILAIEGYLDSHEKRILLEQEGIRRAFQIAMDRSLEKIRESEERYRSLVEISPDTVALLDLNGNIIMMNKAGAELFKYETTQEMIGKNMISFIAPAEQAMARNAFQETLAIGAAGRAEFLVVRKDGVIFDAEFKGAVIFDANGKAQSIMLVGRDITLHKQTERLLSERVMEATTELRKASARLEELVTRSSAVIHAAGIGDGYPTTFISENVLQQLGYSPEQFLSDPDFLFSHVHPQDEERVRFETGCIFDNEQVILEYRFRHRNGEYRWLRDGLRLIRSPEGQPLEIVGSWTDITDGKQAEEVLRKSETRAQAMLHAIPDLMFRMDRQGVFLDYRADNNDLYNQSGNIIGLRNRDIVPSDFADLIDRQIRITLETGELQTFEYRLPIEGRGVREYEARMAVSGADEVTAIVRDVTEQKHMQEALRAAEADYRAIFEKASVGIFRSTADGRFVKVNQAMAEIYGYRSPEEMILEIESIDEQIYVDTSMRREFHNLLAEDSEEQDFIAQNRRRNGSIFWISANARIVKNETGEILYYEGFIEDITERKLIEDNLVEAKESLRLANLGLQQALEREQRVSRTDSLTEAHNRRYFFEIADHEFSVAKRYGKSLSMIMFDIDHFKGFNDMYGHQAGDEILKYVIQIAGEQLREADILARYGGEEFTVLLPNSRVQEAVIVAERIRESVAAYQMDVKGAVMVSITISVGVAELLASTGTLDQLIQQADKAMYAAKDAGRNCVMIYSA